MFSFKKKSSSVTLPAIFIRGRLVDVKGILWWQRKTEAEKAQFVTAHIIFDDGRPNSVFIAETFDACGMGERIKDLRVEKDHLVIVTDSFTFTMVNPNWKEIVKFYKIEMLWRTYTRELIDNITF